VLGASGFLGKHLVKRLTLRGDVVVEASLRDPVAAAARAADCEAIVNLAGEPVAQRWTPAIKERIVATRVDLPRQFLVALARRGCAARVYVSASGIGYYGASLDASFVEGSPPGNDFLAGVCVAWEEQALRAHDLGMRVAVIRTGIALAADGGALAKMLGPFRYGVGGPLGDGRQWFSWIHVDDLTGIYLASLDRGEGAFDATAPNPVTNGEFARALGATLGRPAFLPAPSFALRLLFAEGAAPLLTGQRVLPKRTIEELHYSFAFPTLREALADLLRRQEVAR
jgi:uncharacterized protein (TIGR01777 family)